MQGKEQEGDNQVEYKPWCPSSLIDSFDDHHISGEEELEPEQEEGEKRSHMMTTKCGN